MNTETPWMAEWAGHLLMAMTMYDHAWGGV